MKMTKWLSIFSLLVLLVVRPVFALPPQAEADLLMKEIAEETKLGRFQGLPDKFQRISELAVQVPESFYFHWGRALFENKQYPNAMAHLETYIATAGARGKYYEDALATYTKARDDMKREKAAYERAYAEYVAQLNDYPNTLKQFEIDEAARRADYDFVEGQRRNCFADCAQKHSGLFGTSYAEDLQCRTFCGKEFSQRAFFKGYPPSKPSPPSKPVWMN